MQANVGGLDRILRIIVGLVLIAYALGYIAPDTGSAFRSSIVNLRADTRSARSRLDPEWWRAWMD